MTEEGGALGKLSDRIKGKMCDDDLSSAVLAWAACSQKLLSLLEDSMLISVADRDLCAELCRERLDGLVPLEGFDADQLMALEGKCRASAERSARAEEVR